MLIARRYHMKQIHPNYYKKFTCIADRCRHSCCIGWEIDIDSETYEKYKKVPGDFGDRLRTGISHGETPCFKLGEGDRCTFLNERGLCDIILTLGDDALCGICADHPRFRNFFADRTETGLGISCEEACRIILSETEPMHLLTKTDDGMDEPDPDDEVFFAERYHVFSVLGNRQLSLSERFTMLSEEYTIPDDAISPAEWAAFYRRLERLDPAWDTVLDRLGKCAEFAIPDGTAWENLAMYIVYRHSANYGVCDSVAFAIHAVRMLCTVADDFSDICDVCRMWSSEIEYSEENTEKVFSNIGIASVEG